MTGPEHDERENAVETGLVRTRLSYIISVVASRNADIRKAAKSRNIFSRHRKSRFCEPSDRAEEGIDFSLR
jgi:hypothetical protein